jgi:hypothetical protein
MSHRLAICSVIAVTASLASSQPASAAGEITYDTVDAIEVRSNVITVTGIKSGQAGPSTATYTIASSPTDSGFRPTDEAAARCDRLALLAASKPGKFQFAVVQLGSSSNFSCKLIVRTL